MTLDKLDTISSEIKAKRLRTQAKELSPTSLAKKFERTTGTIYKIRDNRPVDYVPQDEQDLIRACLDEREDLLEEARDLAVKTKPPSRRAVEGLKPGPQVGA